MSNKVQKLNLIFSDLQKEQGTMELLIFKRKKKMEELKKELTELELELKEIIEEKELIKKPEIKTEVLSASEISDVELFFRNIEEKIYANIEKNIDQTSIKNNAFVNIRVTILKDGRYEQLTFMDGSKDNFELFKPSITQVFPLQMNDTLKENFPRYFRMKIEIK